MIDNRLQLDTVALTIDRSHQAVRIRFLHPGRPAITTQLLEELRSSQDIIANIFIQDRKLPSYCQIWCTAVSAVPCE